MNGFAWLQNELTRAFGLTLLHFVWQGMLIALVLRLALAGMRTMTAQARYAACGLALLAMAAAPVATMLVVYPRVTDPVTFDAMVMQDLGTEVSGSQLAQNGNPEASIYIADPAAQSAHTSLGTTLKAQVAAHLHWLVMLWLAGVVALSIWNLGGFMTVQRLRRNDVEPVGGAWPIRLEALAARLGINRTVELLLSARVDVPTVMGALKPVILLPASALTGLTPRQLEAVLLHELAHIRRHDYVVNLLQTAIETLLFYHPAVWWVSAAMREEREHCCDDMVLRVHDDPRGYVMALTVLETLRSHRPNTPALAATDGALLNRVRRILGSRAASPRRRVSGMIAALLPAAMILAGSVAVYTERQIRPEAPMAPEAPVIEMLEPVEPEAPSPVVLESPTVSASPEAPAAPLAAKTEAPRLIRGGEIVAEVHLDKPMITMLAATLQAQGKPGSDIFTDTGIERLDLEVVRRDGTEQLDQGFRALSRQLINEGWTPFVRVAEENVSVLIRTSDLEITGVKVLADNGDELVHMELSGTINPGAFGRKLGRLLAMIGSGEFDLAVFRQLVN